MPLISLGCVRVGIDSTDPMATVCKQRNNWQAHLDCSTRNSVTLDITDIDHICSLILSRNTVMDR